MLKACCECLTGSGVFGGGANNEGSYGTQLNGASESVPLRPVRSPQRNMFVMPRTLSDGDNVEVSGTFEYQNRFTANLLTGSPNPDYNNIACQLETDFQNNHTELRVIENGQTEVIPGSYQSQANGMMTGSQVKLKFKFEEQYGRNSVIIFVNDSSLDMIELKHDIDQITFLELTGDVKVTGLAFTFA